MTRGEMHVSAKTLNFLMKREGLSQRSLAQKAGMSLCSLNRIIKGHQSPRLDTLNRIALVLGVTAQLLLEEERE